ncbi:MAG: alpha-galactosidase [Kiritimatiellia bacterium]|nr:alpha-galactosidase [Lentisphaerota bacterium]
MKMVIIGAGSGFGSRLSVDVLSREPLQDSTIALCDIDENKLKTVQTYIEKVIKTHKLPARVVSSTDRTDVLKDADFVVISVAVGGPAYYDEPYSFEIGIPAKYGIKQTVGDTLNPGGIFRALRTAPALTAMAEDISRLAPRAIILNYTNPMAILTWILNEHADVPTVGLCHSVQGTSKKLASYIDVPYNETGHWVAGINHMAWFLKFTHNGSDALPRLWKAMENPEIFATNPIRFEIMREFGYFVTESSQHMSEYVPWYQHDQPVMEQFGSLADRVKPKRQSWLKDMGVKTEQADSIELVRSHEYASEIMEGVTTGIPIRFNGNVMNDGLIDNLPPGCCVEVPCLADNMGVHPCRVGSLPPSCAALNRTSINVQELAVEAIRKRDKQTAFQAILMDPSVGAVLSIAQARAMFNEIWEAEGELLEAYGR